MLCARDTYRETMMPEFISQFAELSFQFPNYWLSMKLNDMADSKRIKQTLVLFGPMYDNKSFISKWHCSENCSTPANILPFSADTIFALCHSHKRTADCGNTVRHSITPPDNVMSVIIWLLFICQLLSSHVEDLNLKTICKEGSSGETPTIVFVRFKSFSSEHVTLKLDFIIHHLLACKLCWSHRST